MKCISQERLIESYNFARSYGYDKLIKNYIKCSNVIIDTELFSEPHYQLISIFIIICCWSIGSQISFQNLNLGMKYICIFCISYQIINIFNSFYLCAFFFSYFKSDGLFIPKFSIYIRFFLKSSYSNFLNSVA